MRAGHSNLVSSRLQNRLVRWQKCDGSCYRWVAQSKSTDELRDDAKARPCRSMAS